jgi:uncharacterized cupin superfamily protein
MDGFELRNGIIHLGLGATASFVGDFAWTPEALARYEATFASDGNEGRLVCISAQDATWDSWERHPAGEEVVLLLSGRVDVVQDLPEGERVIALHPGEALINPTGVWHTSRVHEPGQALFITPGRGTEHRP